MPRYKILFASLFSVVATGAGCAQTPVLVTGPQSAPASSIDRLAVDDANMPQSQETLGGYEIQRAGRGRAGNSGIRGSRPGGNSGSLGNRNGNFRGSRHGNFGGTGRRRGFGHGFGRGFGRGFWGDSFGGFWGDWWGVSSLYYLPYGGYYYPYYYSAGLYYPYYLNSYPYSYQPYLSYANGAYTPGVEGPLPGVGTAPGAMNGFGGASTYAQQPGSLPYQQPLSSSQGLIQVPSNSIAGNSPSHPSGQVGY